jgi:cellulose synthase operon protein C
VSRRLALLVGALALLLAPTPGRADRSLPSWSGYQAARAVHLGGTALLRGDLEAADTLSLRAIDLDPGDPVAWRLRCAVLADSGRWTDAEAPADRLLALAPEDVDAALVHGRVSLELGRRDAAAASYERAAGLDEQDARGVMGLALVAARLDRDPEQTGLRLQEARSRQPGLDLSALPLDEAWASLADDEPFLAVLTAVLAQPAPPPPSESGPPPK